jgi:hypothetical protein
MPIQKAKLHYGEGFEDLLDYYLENGVVISDYYCFVMACLVNKDDIMNNNNFELDTYNAWYVHYAVGDMKRIYDLAPIDAEWVIFQRGEFKPMKCYKYERLRGLVYGWR